MADYDGKPEPPTLGTVPCSSCSVLLAVPQGVPKFRCPECSVINDAPAPGVINDAPELEAPPPPPKLEPPKRPD
jgi:LSD1 subclass zinc finger protein